MSVETLQYLSIGCYILAGVLFLIAAILFVVFKIPAVIGDLSGATARKAIENIRQQQNSTSDELSASAQKNISQGNAKAAASGSAGQSDQDIGFRISTAKLRTDPLQKRAARSASETTVLRSTNETTVLSGMNETTVLSGTNETTVLSGMNETTVLSGMNETTVLNDSSTTVPLQGGNESKAPENAGNMPIPFIVEYEIGFWMSTEIIE